MVANFFKILFVVSHIEVPPNHPFTRPWQNVLKQQWSRFTEKSLCVSSCYPIGSSWLFLKSHVIPYAKKYPMVCRNILYDPYRYIHRICQLIVIYPGLHPHSATTHCSPPSSRTWSSWGDVGITTLVDLIWDVRYEWDIKIGYGTNGWLVVSNMTGLFSMSYMGCPSETHWWTHIFIYFSEA